MTDVSSLVVEVDASSSTKAGVELDKLTEAAGRAEDATAKLGQSTDYFTNLRNREYEAEMKLRQGLDASTDSTQRLTLGQQEYLENLQRTADMAGLSAKGMMEYQAAEMGVGDEAQRFIDKIAASGGAMDGMGISLDSSRAKLQLFRMGQDALLGNFPRLLMATMSFSAASGVAGMVFTATGAAVLGVVAAMGGLATAYIQGQKEVEKFNDSVQATGGYIGLTKGQFDQLAQSISQSANVSIGNAKEGLQELASTGRLTGDEMQVLGKTMQEQHALTGESLQNLAKDYAKMPEGVVEWATEHNKSMHFMSLAQEEYIESLEKSGQQQQAIIEVGKLLDAEFDSNAVHLGYLERALNATKQAWSDFWNAAKGVGRPATTEEQLGALGVQIEQSRQRAIHLPKADPNMTPGDAQSILQSQVSQQSILQSDLLTQRRAAAHQAAMDQTNQEGIAAHTKDQAILDGLKTKQNLQKAIHDEEVGFAAQAKAGKPVSAADQKAILASVRSGYETKAPAKHAPHAQNTSDYAALIANIDKYNAATDAQGAADARLTANDKWRIDTLAALDVAYGKGQTSLSSYVRLYDQVQDAYAKRSDADQQVQEAKDLAKANDDASKEREREMASLQKQGDAMDTKLRKQQDETKAVGLTKEAIAELTKQRDLDAASILQATAIKELDRDLDYAKYDATIRVVNGMKALANEVTKTGAAQTFQNTPLQKYITGIEQDVNNLQTVAVKAFKSMEDALVQFAMTGQLDFTKMVDSMIADLIRYQIQQSITLPLAMALQGAGGLGGMLGGLGGWLGSLFGFAEGGTPPMGVPSLVGEKGPELFVPSTSGTIVPNGAWGGSNVTVNVVESSDKAGTQQTRTDSNGGKVVDVFVAQIKAAIATDIARGTGPIPTAMNATYGLNRAAGAY